MRKIAKNAVCLFLVGAMLLPTMAEAKTLGQLKKDLQTLESSLNQNQTDTKMTQEQIDAANENVKNIKAEIETTNNEVQKLIGEIETLNNEITKKNEEIKSIINFVQVSSGESAYLEYIFGAKDFTDFIYRVAISEQMVNYNDKLVADYDAMVKKNNEKKETLTIKQVELGKKQQELEVQMSLLGEKMSSLQEGKLDLASQIKAQKEAINGLKGCRDSEDASSCAARLAAAANTGGGGNGGGGNVVTSGIFIRPITAGSVSSEYGNRFHPTQGVWRLHTGIDVTASGSAVPIYPGAAGRVAAITWRSSCGGNVVYLHHSINGKSYTSVYMHLRTINVSVGQTVGINTQIATMGGSASSEYWDSCSTGQHLHYTLATGLYFIDYSSYSAFEGHTFNPRNAVSFPATGGYFSGR
ncbi:MAG: peptidoglycan DD-metalloendopeptidase family protein [Bacilli bacterium]|nr:peptidoglycan DD-metalloendopeptidase family protein [Bacilli bacterium]